MSKAQEGYECEYQVQNEMLNDAKKLFVEAELSDSEREEKIKEIANYALKLSNEYIGIIEDLERFESLLRMDIRYRDHFIHQFQVFLLGYYMINHSGNLQNLLVEYLKEKGYSGSDEDLLDPVITCWFLI